jgi:hypothetical protein
MRPIQLTIPILLAGLATACTPVDYGIGEIAARNAELQIVDPEPRYAGTAMEGESGQRAADAVDRYQRGEVKQPAQTSTTASTGGSGSGSSSSTSSGGGPR